MTIKVTYNVTDVYMTQSVSPVYITVSYSDGGASGGGVWGSITGTLSNQTDLQSALDLKVPYSGATGNVNLGEYELKAGQVTLDTSPTGTAAVGTIRWNDTTGTSETTLKGGNVIIKNGVDLVARVVNKVSPNTTLTKAAYQAVRVSGAQGQRLAIELAQANNDAGSADTIGLVTETIAPNQEGFIMTVGQLEGINTTGSLQGETWVDGDVLYLSPTTAGAITNIQPTGSGHIVVIGYVEYAHANNGKIYVKVLNGWELTELHDTEIVSPANNEALIYESSSALWKNKTIATALGYTPVPTTRNITINGVTYDLSADRTFSVGSITGNGSTNELAYFTASTTLASLSVSTYPSLTEISYVKGVTSALQTQLNAKQGTLTLTTTGTSGAATLVGNTLNIPQYSGGGGGGISGSGAAGQVTYWTGSSAVSGSNNLYWDNANGRLGIGTNAPATRLSVTNTVSGEFISTFRASGSPNPSLNIEDGDITIPNLSTAGFNPPLTSNTIGIISCSSGASGGLAFTGITNINGGNPLYFQGVSGKNSGNTNAIVTFVSGKHNNTTSVTSLAASEIPFEFVNWSSTIARFYGNGNFLLQNGGTFTDGGQRLQVYGDTLLRGSSATSATTALTVQNSSSTNLLTVRNDGLATFGGNISVSGVATFTGLYPYFELKPSGWGTQYFYLQAGVNITAQTAGSYTAILNTNASRGFTFIQGTNNSMTIEPTTYNVLIGTTTDVASSICTLHSTTKGFLPPRMTTTQKNAISTPAAGLVVYDTTLNKLCVYTTAWETITSI